MINCWSEKQNKNKNKKSFARVTEKELKREESLNTCGGKFFKRNVQNAMEYCYATWKMKLYPWKFSVWTCTKLSILFDLGKRTRRFIFYAYQGCFHENYWPRLTSVTKCRGSISHGDIKFWFSGNFNTGRHCLLLHIHLSYYVRCITSFQKIVLNSYTSYLTEGFVNQPHNFYLPTCALAWYST